MRLVAVTLVGALFMGGCAMQAGEPGTEESAHPGDIVAEPGGAETTPIDRGLPFAQWLDQGRSPPVSAPTSPSTAVWLAGQEGLTPEAAKPPSCNSNQPQCEDPVPVPWQQSGPNMLSAGAGALAGAGHGN